MTESVDTPTEDGLTSEPLANKVWGRLASAVALLWILFVSCITQLTAWLMPLFGLPGAPQTQVAVLTLFQSILLLLLLTPLALLWRAARYRAIFWTWLVAALFLLAQAPTRLLPATQSQLLSLVQTVVTLIFVWILWKWKGSRPASPQPDVMYGVALGAAAIFATIWLVLGALGSVLDIVLQSAVAASFALAFAMIIRNHWQAAPAKDRRGSGRDMVGGGVVVGAALLIMSSGLSFNGTQLLLMLSLPSLGWIVAASGAPALLIGLSAAAPLLFVDTDAMNLAILDPLLGGYFLAAGIAMVAGWVVGIAVLLARRRLPHVSPSVAGAGAAILWAAAVALYLAMGQPGLYGDRIFVILKEQADVSRASSMQDYDARRQYVYDTLVDHAQRTQADMRTAIEQLGITYAPYYLVNGVEVQGGLLMQLWLSLRPDVDRVLPSPVLRPMPWPLPTAQGEATAPNSTQWNLTQIGAPRVWEEFGITGEGILVGQSDSGVQVDHPEFAARYRGRFTGSDYNWFDPWYHSLQPSDPSGHGTHTLGSALGSSVGVAPGASWFACANLIRNLGNPALYLDCMQFMLAPFPANGKPLQDGDPTRSAHVLNNSWGCPQNFEGCDPNALLPGLRALRAAGIFVVASAGNEGPRCSTITDSLAIYREAFSVGAVDRFGDLAPFSSSGPVTVDGSGRTKPDILAPGVNVLSAYPGSTYEFADGTSMAGPHVAGVVALMWSANRNLIGDIVQTEQILQESASPFTGTLGSLLTVHERQEVDELVGVSTFAGGILADEPVPDACLAQVATDEIPNNVAGYGIINAYDAVKRALDIASAP